MNMNDSLDQIPAGGPVSVGLLNRLIGVVRSLRKMWFDPTFFTYSTTNGFPQISVRRGALGGAALDAEWGVAISTASTVVLTVTPADVPWVTRTIMATRAGEPLTITPIDVDFTAVAVGEKRWLCAKIDHRADSGAGSLTAEITADDQKALCDPANGITRVNLSCWLKVSDVLIQQYGPQAHVGQIAFYPAEPPPLP